MITKYNLLIIQIRQITEFTKKNKFLINKYPEYLFLLETKGDILRSHGLQVNL